MKLLTIRQFQALTNLTRHQVDGLVRNGLEHVVIGPKRMITEGAWERWILESTVKKCREEAKAPACTGSTSAVSTTSSGLNKAEAGIAAQVRQIAASQKSRLRNSSTERQRKSGPSTLDKVQG